jgi:tetratricopeptide (TPR) repeat protein
MKWHRLLLTSTVALLAFTGGAPAQQVSDPPRLELADGRVLYPKAIRRDNETIIVTLETPATKPGEQPGRGDFGFALKDIYTLHFPKPAILDAAPGLIATGKASDALAQLERDLKFYTGLRDAPGSWWDELVPLQIQALLALRRDKDAADAADNFARLANNAENKRISKAFIAVSRTRKGDHEPSLPLYDEAYKSTKRPDIQGLIAVNKGDSLVALGDVLKAKGELDQAASRYEAALLSYLRIPALYPSQRQYLPQSTLGAARAYFGMDDFDRALTAIKELRQGFPGTPEAEATADLETKVRKRKEQLADPKAAAAEAEKKPAS